MKTKTLSYTPILFCILILWSACKDDADAPLRFYDSKYEVPMGGRRYLGIESGNVDYSLEIGNPSIASAGIESGWSGVPAGRMIYISGILTGSTYLKVTDNATQETLTLPIKVVDYYEDLNLIHGSSSLRPNGDENLLPGVDDIFLVSNAARDAYFFKQGQRTAFSSGLELITKGTYALKQEDENKATLTLTFSLDASPATEHHFTVWGNTYLLHRLDKNLHLNWGTPPIGETRTSPAPPPAYTLEEITEGAEPGTGRQVGFILNYKEIPTGILP